VHHAASDHILRSACSIRWNKTQLTVASETRCITGHWPNVTSFSLTSQTLEKSVHFPSIRLTLL